MREKDRLINDLQHMAEAMQDDLRQWQEWYDHSEQVDDCVHIDNDDHGNDSFGQHGAVPPLEETHAFEGEAFDRLGSRQGHYDTGAGTGLVPPFPFRSSVNTGPPVRPQLDAMDSDEIKKLLGFSMQAPKIQIPAFPKITEQHEWTINLIRNLQAASKFEDGKEIEWIGQCKRLSFSELGYKGDRRFGPMDRSLAESAYKILPPELRVRVERKEKEHFAERDQLLSGRQIVYMIYEYLNTEEHMSVLFNYKDLNSVQWRGDTVIQLEKVLSQWDYVVDNFRGGKPSEQK